MLGNIRAADSQIRFTSENRDFSIGKSAETTSMSVSLCQLSSAACYAVWKVANKVAMLSREIAQARSPFVAKRNVPDGNCPSIRDQDQNCGHHRHDRYRSASSSLSPPLAGGTTCVISHAFVSILGVILVCYLTVFAACCGPSQFGALNLTANRRNITHLT